MVILVTQVCISGGEELFGVTSSRWRGAYMRALGRWDLTQRGRIYSMLPYVNTFLC